MPPMLANIFDTKTDKVSNLAKLLPHSGRIFLMAWFVIVWRYKF